MTPPGIRARRWRARLARRADHGSPQRWLFPRPRGFARLPPGARGTGQCAKTSARPTSPRKPCGARRCGPSMAALAMRARALEAAQRLLAEALAQGAPRRTPRSIAGSAAARHRQLSASAGARSHAQRRDRKTPRIREEQTQVSGQDIEEMLREVERLSEQGRNREAQQMLQTLASILDNLDVRLDENQQAGGEAATAAACSKAWTSSPKPWANSARSMTKPASNNN